MLYNWILPETGYKEGTRHSTYPLGKSLEYVLLVITTCSKIRVMALIVISFLLAT